MGQARLIAYRDPTDKSDIEIFDIVPGSTIEEAVSSAGFDALTTAVFRQDDNPPPDDLVREGDELTIYVAPEWEFLLVQLISFLIATAVQLIISYLFRPDDPAAQKNLPTPSTVYSVGNITNEAKLGAVLPTGYGRFVITPPLAAQPFVSYFGNEQYFYGLYALGVGSYDVSNVFLADADEAELGGDVEYTLIPPNVHKGIYGRVKNNARLDGFQENMLTSPAVANIQLSKPDPDKSVISGEDYLSVRFFNGSVDIINPGASVMQRLKNCKNIRVSRGNTQHAVTNTGHRAVNRPNFNQGPNILKLFNENFVQDNPGGFKFGKHMKWYNDGGDQVWEWEQKDLNPPEIYVGDVFEWQETPYHDPVTGFQDGYVVKSVTRNQNFMRVRSHPIRTDRKAKTGEDYAQWRFIRKIGRRVKLKSYGERGLDQTNFYRAWRDNHECDRIQLDIIAPAGLYTIAGNGAIATIGVSFDVMIRRNDQPENGTIWRKSYNWVIMDNSPIRRTIVIGAGDLDATGRALPDRGLWEVAIARAPNFREDGGNPVDNMSWTSLKSRWSGRDEKGNDRSTGLYHGSKGCTLLAVRVRATGVSQQSTSRIRVKAERILYNINTTEIHRPTRNPADALFDILTASYGARLPRSEIDIDGTLMEARKIANKHNITFDAVFDMEGTIADAMKVTAQVIPAIPTMIGNKIGLVRIKEVPFPQYLFTDFDVKEQTPKLGYSFMRDDDPKGVIVEYRDQYRFALQEATAGYTENDQRVERIKLFGCTDHGLAKEFANYYWQRLKRQRRTISFTTGLDGYLPSYGDRISTSFDLIHGRKSSIVTAKWGKNGRRYVNVDPPAPANAIKAAGRLTSNGKMSWVFSTQVTNGGTVVDVTDWQVTNIQVGGSVLTFSTKDNGDHLSGASYTVMSVKSSGPGEFTIEGIEYHSGIFQMRGMRE